MTKFAKIAAVAVVALGGFAFASVASAVSASSIYSPATGFLRVGSGMGAKAYQAPQVMAAQEALNACMPGMDIAKDGKFGPMTETKFKAFQASKMIAQDGIIGPITAAQLAACSGDNSSTPSTPSTGLNGGAGDITVTNTSTDVEDTVKEGDTEKVLGFEIEAEGSDVEITNVRLVLKNDGFGPSTERLDRYVDEVSIWMGDEEVGTVDADDFNRESGSPDEFTATIALDGAVVEENDKMKFYVGVSALSSIDSDDQNDADWNVTLETIRYEDATGAILSDSSTQVTNRTNNFDFEDASAEDDLDIKSSSNNPDEATLKVEKNDASDEFMIGAFKFDVDEDSSDITLMEIPVVITFGNYDVDGDGDVDASDDSTDDSAAENVVDTLTIEIDGDSFEADLDAGSVSIANGAGTATYMVDLSDEDVVIDSGDVIDVEVFATFNDQDGNYNSGMTVKASVDGLAVDAEGEDELDADGSFNGKVHTLSLSSATLSGVQWSVGTAGTIIDFIFTLEAEDEDVEVLLAEIIANDTVTGTATVAAPTLERISGDAETIVGGFEVLEGDTAKFRVRYAVSGVNGTFANVTITSVAGQNVDDEDELSPTATVNVN